MRISRLEYLAGNLLASVIPGLITYLDNGVEDLSSRQAIVVTVGMVLGIYWLVHLNFRRLHDLGKPSWHIWFTFIPIVSYVYGFIFIFFKGQPVKNQWGDPPQGFSWSAINPLSKTR